MEQWHTFRATPCWGSQLAWFRACYESFQLSDGVWASRLIPGTLERVADPQASFVETTAKDVLY